MRDPVSSVYTEPRYSPTIIHPSEAGSKFEPIWTLPKPSNPKLLVQDSVYYSVSYLDPSHVLLALYGDGSYSATFINLDGQGLRASYGTLVQVVADWSGSPPSNKPQKKLFKIEAQGHPKPKPVHVSWAVPSPNHVPSSIGSYLFDTDKVELRLSWPGTPRNSGVIALYGTISRWTTTFGS